MFKRKKWDKSLTFLALYDSYVQLLLFGERLMPLLGCGKMTHFLLAKGAYHMMQFVGGQTENKNDERLNIRCPQEHESSVALSFDCPLTEANMKSTQRQSLEAQGHAYGMGFVVSIRESWFLLKRIYAFHVNANL